ncbi:DUF1189 family protein [Abiotrophia defectiva]|uniref:DUF1189 family protein n=1 Tax=Abiotrophia defectiva TaxID=46125 RepID=UPI0026ED4FAE|nr:DUF1189 family protein [Abiotrophia defectiva]
MKQLIAIIFSSMRMPQQIFGLSKVPFKFFRRLSRLIILWLTVTSILVILKPLNQLFDDVKASSSNLPDFHTVDGKLELAQDQKPVYFQSQSFQLVVDDTVTVGGPQDQPTIPTDIASRLSTKSMASFFLFKDRAFGQVAGRMMQITDLYKANFNTQVASQTLNSIENYRWFFYLSLFIVAWIISWLLYWFVVLLISYLAHFTTLRSKSFKLFSQTMRLVIQVTFVPFLIYGLLQIIMPLGFVFFVFLALYTVAFIYYAQQRFMMSLFSAFNSQAFKEGMQDLQEDANKLSPEEMNERFMSLIQEARQERHDQGEGEEEEGEENSQDHTAQDDQPSQDSSDQDQDNE